MSYTQAAWYVCDICHNSHEVGIGDESPGGWGRVGARDVCDSCSTMISAAIRSMMWRAGERYGEGQLVVFDEMVYKAGAEHDSSAENRPGVGTLWTEAQ